MRNAYNVELVSCRACGARQAPISEFGDKFGICDTCWTKCRRYHGANWYGYPIGYRDGPCESTLKQDDVNEWLAHTLAKGVSIRCEALTYARGQCGANAKQRVNGHWACNTHIAAPPSRWAGPSNANWLAERLRMMADADPAFKDAMKQALYAPRTS